MKKFKITVNGKAYEVTAELVSDSSAPAPATTVAPAATSASVAPAAPAPKKEAPKTAGSGEVLSPLAGKVVSLDVKVGQAVAEGEKLITLEAMKMNTFVIAPKAGTLKEFLTSPGQAVEEGAVLARIE